MSYKFVIKEVALEEGELEDYYNKLAKAQGAKTTRSLGIQEPANASSGPDPRIAAYYAKKEAEKEKAERAAATEKEKTDNATATAAKKKRAATEKQFARDYAGLEKQDKRDQKAAAQKFISDAQKEVGFLKNVTQEMRIALKLDDSAVKLALDTITSKYIGKGTLAEAGDSKIKPLQAAAGAAEFRKYYGNVIDASAFSDFQDIIQIINFLRLYEENLKKVQAKVGQITRGKQLKVNLNLIRTFEKNKQYLTQIK